MNTENKVTARFDARIPKAQKDFFEKAAFLGGYRSLTDFIILTLQEKAKAIVSESERIIASEEDSRIFFEAIAGPVKHNQALSEAFKKYNKFISINNQYDNTTKSKNKKNSI